jgi:predicted nucleotidyltransferase
MDVARPYAAVTGGGLEGEVLAVLAGTTKPLTGREVARLARRGSDRGIRLALNRLAEHGLVDTLEARPAVLHTLNREHIAAPVALALIDLRSALFDRLRAAIGSWAVPAAHASLFGSAARGDGDTRSDIDVFIVRPATVSVEDAQWRSQLDALSHEVTRSTGNHAGISELGEDELPQLLAERPPVVAELEREAVTLAGPDARRLFTAATGSGE